MDAGVETQDEMHQVSQGVTVRATVAVIVSEL